MEPGGNGGKALGIDLSPYEFHGKVGAPEGELNGLFLHEVCFERLLLVHHPRERETGCKEDLGTGAVLDGELSPDGCEGHQVVVVVADL
jgi:hypothetical protein